MTETIVTEPTVELVKAAPPFAPDDYFDRGERIIMVNGVRWGRTHVKWHGCNGNSVHFEQEGGDMLCRDPHDAETWKEYRWLSVRSLSKRHSRQWVDGKYVQIGWQSTEDLALAKAKELIAAGRLRHPDTLRAEAEVRQVAYQNERMEKQERRQREFRERACQALGINQDDGSDIIDRVVTAMEWARDQ